MGHTLIGFHFERTKQITVEQAKFQRFREK
jgi:hypothetical protein